MWGQTDEARERKYNQVGWWLKLKEGEEQAKSLNTEVSIYSGGDRTQMNWLQFSVDVGWLLFSTILHGLYIPLPSHFSSRVKIFNYPVRASRILVLTYSTAVAILLCHIIGPAREPYYMRIYASFSMFYASYKWNIITSNHSHLTECIPIPAHPS